MSTFFARLAEGSGHSFEYHGFDQRDVRSSCVKTLMRRSGMNFHLVRNISAHAYGSALGGDNDTHYPKVFDLCFLDGDHTHSGLKADVQSVMGACRYIMLHDILEPNNKMISVSLQWADMQRECPSSEAWTCTQGKYNRLGIAVQQQPCLKAKSQRRSHGLSSPHSMEVYHVTAHR